jgi:hypothetical protein
MMFYTKISLGILCTTSTGFKRYTLCFSHISTLRTKARRNCEVLLVSVSESLTHPSPPRTSDLVKRTVNCAGSEIYHLAEIVVLHLSLSPLQFRVGTVIVNISNRMLADFPSVLFWFVGTRHETDSVFLKDGQYDRKIYRIHLALVLRLLTLTPLANRHHFFICVLSFSV